MNVLTSPELLKTTEVLLHDHRERRYPPMVTLSVFMRQVLEADSSCQMDVHGRAAQRAADGRSRCCARVLPGSPAAAPGEGQYVHAPDRALARPEGEKAMALSRPRDRPGGRHQAVDARYAENQARPIPSPALGPWRGLSQPCPATKTPSMPFARAICFPPHPRRLIAARR